MNDVPAEARVLVLGLERFARYNPVDALGAWKTIGGEVSDASGRDRVEHAIAYRGLLDREPQLRAWIDDNLSRWARDDFTEIRLRWAIADSDWEAIARVSTSRCWPSTEMT